MAGIRCGGKVVTIQVTSPVRVRAAMARAGIQAMALAESQVLWLRVAGGGTGIFILNSTAPTFGTSGSFSAKKILRRFSSQVRNVAGLNRTGDWRLYC